MGGLSWDIDPRNRGFYQFPPRCRTPAPSTAGVSEEFCMHLASYIIRGRSSYGAVVGDGVVDLRLRFGARHATLVDVLRADALEEARALLRGVRPDYALGEVELLPPLLAPEKIL